MSAIASRWKQLPIAASFLVVCGVVIVGAIYTVSYRQRESYLTGRNFRLLAVLAQQTESAIDGYSHTRTATLGQSALPTATQIDLTDGQSRLTLVFGTGKKRTIDSQKIGHILRPVFKTKIGQGAFDTLALAEPSGKLVLAVGRREWEMSSMTLSALLPDRKVADGPPASEPGTPRNAAVAGGSPSPATSRAPANAPAISFERITVLDAVVAGVPYKMFIQPCCELVTQPSPGPAGAVVVGLVPSTALRDEAMAISPTLVVITILLIVLAGLAWPFLNVALQGHRKRITRWDAFQLGFSGTVGLAIATILAITSLQCGRLERDLGRQLADLAAELDAGLSKEIDESTKTLDALAKWLAACPRSSAPVGYVVDEGCKRKGAANPGDEAVKKLDNYDFVSLIDSEGQQQMKARPSQREPPLVNVSERWYFQSAIRYAREPTMWATLGETASITCFGPPCVLDSVVSYTTGKPSAVLARPSGDRSLPVAALTLPMRSVIDPVLPPGFEFAIIDKHGRVVFHSDLQRNAFENLFLETDRNPQLRGLVATGVDGPVTMEYWGRPYIAHVKHARAYGWSIVTLFNRRDLRALMLEWTMVSIMLLAAYALLWAATLGLVVARGASWLWPDRFRRRRYALLNVFYLSLLVAFGLWATSSLFDRSAMAIAGFLVPLVACGAGALVLKHQPAARVGTARLEYRCDYCIPATLLLIVIGILPGASFVARSYDVHVEAYVKHRQLGLVQGLLAPPPAEDDTERGDLGTPRRSANAFKRWYSQFLDRTSICRESVDGDTDAAHESGLESFGACAITRNADEAADPGHGKGRDPFGLLEAYLPYFSEMSVKIRELVHPRADDGSWTSERSKGMTILRVPQPGATPQRVVTASTALPPLINGEGGPLLVMALILVAMAYGIAYFIARYVFLGQVSAPLWALGRLAIPEGRPVILLCDPAVMTPRIHGAAHLPLEPLLRSDDPRAGADPGAGAPRWRSAPRPADSGDGPGFRRVGPRRGRSEGEAAGIARGFAPSGCDGAVEAGVAGTRRGPGSRAPEEPSGQDPGSSQSRSRKGSRDRAGLARAPRSGRRTGHAYIRLRNSRLVASSDGSGAAATSRGQALRLPGQAQPGAGR